MGSDIYKKMSSTKSHRCCTLTWIIDTKECFYYRVIFKFCGLHLLVWPLEKLMIFYGITGCRRCPFPRSTSISAQWDIWDCQPMWLFAHAVGLSMGWILWIVYTVAGDEWYCPMNYQVNIRRQKWQQQMRTEYRLSMIPLGNHHTPHYS